MQYDQWKMSEYDLFKFEMIGRDQTPVPVSMEEVKEVEEVPGEEIAEPTPEPETIVEATPEKYYLRPVYFDFDSYALSKNDMAKLDILSSILEKHTALKIEITGHTDSKGTVEYNQRLSDNRANAVYKYLILKGVAKVRMKVSGMSESQHVARNTTLDQKDAPEGRMLNRRVEFKISLMEGVVVEMEKIEIPEHLKLDK